MLSRARCRVRLVEGDGDNTATLGRVGLVRELDADDMGLEAGGGLGVALRAGVAAAEGVPGVAAGESPVWTAIVADALRARCVGSSYEKPAAVGAVGDVTRRDCTECELPRCASLGRPVKDSWRDLGRRGRGEVGGELAEAGCEWLAEVAVDCELAR